MIAARQARARRYQTRLSPAAQRTRAFRLPTWVASRVWYRYAIQLSDRTAVEVVEGMRRLGIGAARPVTDWRPTGGPACPVADRAYARVVSLPLYPTLSEDEQERVCEALEACTG